MKKIISRVFLVIVSIAIIQVLATILLARNLTKPEMGLYRLVFTTVEILIVVALVGLDHSFVRFFSSPGISFQKYNWKAFLIKFFPIPFSIILLVAIVVSYIYNFSISLVFFIILVSTTMVYVGIFCSLLRAIEKYELAIFLNRLSFVFYFLIIVCLYFLKNISLASVLLGYVLAVVLASSSIFFYCFKKIASGELALPVSVLKNGLYYFGMAFAMMSLLYANNLFIGKILSYKDLAVYTVIASIMRLFEFTQDSLYYVLAPYLNRQKNFDLRSIFLMLLSVAIFLALIYIFLGKILIHYLFQGLYDEGVYLLPFFVIIGVIRTLYLLPASIVGGRASESVLRRQFFIISTAAIANVLFIIVLIPRFKLAGAALAAIISWSLVLVLSLLSMKSYTEVKEEKTVIPYAE